MPTKTQPESPAASAVSESLDGARTKAFETVSVLAEANQRVFAHLLELSSVAAREGARTYGDLQSAALNAVRSAPGAGMLFPANMEQLRQDPFAWYRQGIAAAAGATQRVAKLVEANAQIVARGAERLEASAEQTSREIETAIKSCIDRVKEIQGR